MNKRELYIISGGIGLLLIAGIVFFFMLQGDGDSETSAGASDEGGFLGFLPFVGDNTAGGPSGGTPPPASGTKEDKKPILPGEEPRLMQVINKSVVGATTDKNGTKLNYYVRAGGNLERSGLDGKDTETISPLTILGLLEVIWNPARTKGAVIYYDADVVKKFVSEPVINSPIVFLPQSLTALAWSPDSKSIAYLLPQGGSYSLVTAASDGKNPKTVWSTPIPDFTVFWPKASTLLLPTRPSGFAPGLMYSLNPTTKAATKIFDSAYGLTILPSPKGTYLLSAVTDENGKNLKLSLSGLLGESPKELSVKTLPEKCVFAQDETLAYCAVPKNLSTFALLPDDWYMGKAFFDDRLVRINLKTLEAEEVLNEGSFDIVTPFLSPDNKYLFFQDKEDGTLWRLRLAN